MELLDKTSCFQQSKSEKVSSWCVAPSKADSSSMAATDKMWKFFVPVLRHAAKGNRTIMLRSPIAELLQLVNGCFWMPLVLCLCIYLFSSRAMDTGRNRIMSGLLTFCQLLLQGVLPGLEINSSQWQAVFVVAVDCSAQPQLRAI